MCFVSSKAVFFVGGMAVKPSERLLFYNFQFLFVLFVALLSLNMSSFC